VAWNKFKKHLLFFYKISFMHKDTMLNLKQVKSSFS